MTKPELTPLERNPAANDLVWDAVEALSEGIAIYDAQNLLITCNQRYLDMFPLIADQIKRGASWADLLAAGVKHGQYAGAVKNPDEWLQARLHSGVPLGKTLELELTNGDVYLVQFSATSQGGFVVANTDITARKRAELAAQEQEKILRHVIETCPTPLQMTKADSGEVLFSSPESIAMFGDHANTCSVYTDPDARGPYIERLRREGVVRELKSKFLNAAGDPIWVAVSSRLIQYAGEEVIVSHSRDLTEEMCIEQELNQQRDQLHQNEKLSAMSELLAGVAHELNNPLSVVVGHSLMLREDCSDPETVRQIDKISTAAERCARIVKTFLTMARQEPAKIQAVDIREILQTAVDVARYGDAPGDVKIDCNLGPDLPAITVDPDQITQVFINLILNAEQAIKRSGVGGKISVSAQVLPSGRHIEFKVQDDGPGIPKNLQNRVFEPFFSTRDTGKGTGIGLTLTHRIVQTHDGSITVTAAPDSGAVFTVLLPVEASTSQPEANMDQALASASLPRILIVDDEGDVADLNAEILIRAGYQVDVFNDADLALEHLGMQNYGLILSDLNMPGVDGRGFFEAIRQNFPEMIDRTGFVTGDTMGRSSQGFLQEAGRPCIEKPVSPRELRSFVTDILTKAEQEIT